MSDPNDPRHRAPQDDEPDFADEHTRPTFRDEPSNPDAPDESAPSGQGGDGGMDVDRPVRPD